MPVKQLARNSGGKLSRIVLCVFAPFDPSKPKLDKLQSEIVSCIRDANPLIDESIENISAFSPFVIPRVLLRPLTAFRGQSEISDHLESEPSNMRHLVRMCVFSEPQPNMQGNGIDGDVPFFVTVIINDSLDVSLGKYKTGWNADSGLARSILVTSLTEFPRILHDVALDIAMFNSIQLSQSYQTIEQRNHISDLRLAFVLSKGGETRYGQLEQDSLCVVPISSLCWKSNSIFDFSKYVNFCNEFLQQVLTTDDKPTPFKSVDAFRQIFGFKKISGQLSKRKISRHLAELSDGVYILAIAQKKPNREPQAKRVANILGRAVWTRNHWKIFDHSRFPELASLHPYLTLYKFQYSNQKES